MPQGLPTDEAERLARKAMALMIEWTGRLYESAEGRRFAAKIRNGLDHRFTFLVVLGVEPTITGSRGR